jgi:hypothetical protein
MELAPVHLQASRSNSAAVLITHTLTNAPCSIVGASRTVPVLYDQWIKCAILGGLFDLRLLS